MSDIDNGQDPSQAESASLIVNAQYLRDLSFENPRAPESLLQQAEQQPEVSVEVDVRARQLNEETFESVLNLKVQARTGDDVVFMVEVDYGGVVTIRNAAQELTAALVLIETPRLLFPFARAIIADAIREGGFPPLLINPIDFAEIQRRKAMAAANGDHPTPANA